MNAKNNLPRLEEKINNAISGKRAAAAIAEAGNRAAEVLRKNPSKPAAIVQISLDVFGNALPSDFKSCRLSILRGGSEYPVERHPDAEQFVYSLENSGTISSWNDGRWRTDIVSSDPMQPDARRLHRVPANVWHQPIPGKRDWTVLGFHTLPVDKLRDDFAFKGPVPGDSEAKRTEVE